MPAVKCQRSQIDLNKRRRINCKWLGTGWVSFKEGRNHSFRIVSITLSLGQWISMVLEKKEGFFWDSYSFRITNFKDNPYLVYFSKCLQRKPQSPQSFWARSMSVKNFSHGSRGIHPLWKELHSAPTFCLCSSVHPAQQRQLLLSQLSYVLPLPTLAVQPGEPSTVTALTHFLPQSADDWVCSLGWLDLLTS